MAGCASAKLNTQEIPDSLLSCPASPLTPSSQAGAETQADAAAALTGTYLAWEACYDALAQVRKLIKGSGKDG